MEFLARVEILFVIIIDNGGLSRMALLPKKWRHIVFLSVVLKSFEHLFARIIIPKIMFG